MTFEYHLEIVLELNYCRYIQMILYCAYELCN